MSSFVISFLLSSFILFVVIQIKVLVEYLKKRGRKEDLKKVSLFLWEVIPLLLLSFILMFGMKHSQKSLIAKRGAIKDRISLASFARD